MLFVFRYSCGPYAKFRNITGENEWQDTVIATCNWNKTWIPNPIPQCSRNNLHEINDIRKNMQIIDKIKLVLYVLINSMHISATHCKTIIEPPEHTGLKYVPSALTSHLILQSGTNEH